MIRKIAAFGLIVSCLLSVVSLIGCGQQEAATSATTTTTVPPASAVTIKGTTATGVTNLGLRSFASGLGTAEVTIGVPSKESDSIRVIASGTTDSSGNYSILVATAELESLKTSGNLATNVMVIVSREEEIIGCVIPSLSLEAGGIGYAPTASKGDYKKALIARAAFKKGKDPKNFDYSGNIDKKFSSESLRDYDSGKIDAMADSIKSGEDAEEGIGLALGISVASMEAMRKKGFQLHQTYIEPIMRAAFDNKTTPTRAQLDAAFASMEAAMSEYARSLGISEQAIADFKSMKNNKMESKMGESTLLKDDASFKEAKLRMSGDKMINMFLGQWEAAKTLATTAPAGKVTFAMSHEAAYNNFVASKEVIKAQLLNYMGTAGTSPEVIPNYLRTNFFDAFIFPPPNASKASPEAFFQLYGGSRILIYFMSAFLAQADMNTFLRTTQPSMETVFRTRFTDTANSSGYYMGPDFWATRPSANLIQTRLAAFNSALDTAIDNPTSRDIIGAHAGFTTSQTDAIMKAFRILMAPPDVM